LSAQKTDIKDLAPRFQKWLKEEVVYIITPREREVFFSLSNDRERDLFIEAFWKQRDPTPGTPDNEFKRDHYGRINHANHFYGRRAPRPGWRTDRGRVYIILGEPNDVMRFDGSANTYNSEVWFYQGMVEQGLPSGFSLVFFQDGNVGEFRLYSPLKDGPQGLMPAYEGDPMDYYAAYQRLRELEPDLARVSLSLVAGESQSFMGRPSLVSERLLGDINTVPQKMVEDRYAQKFLMYKDIVEVEYTANYMDSDALVKVLKDESGLTFVHYTVELPRLSVSQYQDIFSTSLKVNGTIENQQGKIVYQYDKGVDLRINGDQMKTVSQKPFNYQDMFTLIPGDYKFTVLIKNEVSKEFTSIEQRLFIAEDAVSLQMSPLVLGYNATPRETEQNRPKPFTLGSYQLELQPNRTYVRSDDLAVAFQIFGLSAQQRERGEIRIVILKGDEEIHSVSRNMSHYPESPHFVEEFPLQDFPPAHYRILVSFLVDGQEVVSQKDEFDVTFLDAISRPWTYSRILPPTRDAFYPFILGRQYLNAGMMEKAKTYLEQAYRMNPGDPAAALSLAQVNMALEEYGAIEPLLLPFLAQPQAGYEAFSILGTAYRNLGQWDKAIATYDQAIARFGLNTSLLNAVGECYHRLQNLEEAVKAWEKSLELDPNQPEIKDKVEDIKKRGETPV
jgi:GWxTD domain-containing protein